MLIQSEHHQHPVRIRDYKPGCITINNMTYHTPIIVSSKTVITNNLPNHPSELTPNHFSNLLTLNANIILIGTGEKQFFAPQAWEVFCAKHQVSIDTMSTAAACRTFALLLTESYQVAAILFP